MVDCIDSFKNKPWQSPWIVMFVAIYAFAIPWILGAIILQYWVNEDFSVLAGIGKTLARRILMVGHMTLGALCIILGPTQFLPVIRRKAPRFHRWTGRIYVASAVLCAILGFAFICLKEFVLVGGLNMGFAFATAGLLFAGCAIMTAVKARAKEFTAHRNWSIRAYSQILAPMLYRYFYGILFGLRWYGVVDEECDENDICPMFLRTFDEIHAWSYFLFPLMIAEMIVCVLPKESRGKSVVEPNEEVDAEDQDEAAREDLHQDTLFNYAWLNAFGITGALAAIVCTTVIFISGDPYGQDA